MKFTLQSILHIVLHLLVFQAILSQDINFTSAEYTPFQISIGEESQLTIEILNTIDVPANSVEIQLSLPFNTYTSKANQTPSILSGQYFTWTLKENNYWSGINISPLPANENIIVSLDVIGLMESMVTESMGDYGIIKQFTSSDFLIRPISNLHLFENEDNTNNYIQANLSVLRNSNTLSLLQTTPINLSLDNSIVTDLTLQFDQDVSAESGHIEIRSFDSDELIEQISIYDSRITIDGDMVTVDIRDLEYSETYYVLISSGTLVGQSNNLFSGINGQSIWSFTTEPDPSLITCIQESFESTSGYNLSNTFDDGYFSFFGKYNVPDYNNEARNDAIIGWEGDYGILGQNFSESGYSDIQEITIENIDISEFLSYQISISVAALNSEPQNNNYEIGDGIKIYSQVDNNPTVLIAEFAPNSTGQSDLYLDTDSDGIGDGEKLTRELQTFTFSKNALVGSELDIIISMSSNDGFELLAVDNIRVHSDEVSDCDFIEPTYAELEIYTIQGTDEIADYEGQVVTTTGIINGEFQGSNGLDGFFMQTDDGDNVSQTSDGIFVHLPSESVLSDINLFEGDKIKVTGLVTERLELTTLDHLLDLEIVNVGHQLDPIDVTMPESVNGELEQYEGMLVSITNPMTVTQNYFLGQYGQLALSSPDDAGNEGRLFQPTNQFLPNSPEAINLEDSNQRRVLILDDGQDQSIYGDNPDPVPFIDPITKQSIRAGDQVTNLVGVIDQGRINSNWYNPDVDYRLQPLEEPNFSHINMQVPNPTIAEGNIKIASFNVLNYFNGDGQGGGFPTARGADSEAEFAKQSAKIVQAIQAIDADIVGLIELENDGYSANSAIQHLVNELNAAYGSSVYQFVDAGGPLGTDAIAVGLIFKPDVVNTNGNPAVLTSSVNPLFDDQKNRPTLAQTFVKNGSTTGITILVNHLKSKGSDCDSVGDPDTGDGQGNCNQTRTNAAIAISEWIATDPTNSGSPDYLIIGDLNAYAKEDPLTALENNGFTKATNALSQEDQYSYVFDGNAGMLDHILSSSSVNTKIEDISIWHINADEPVIYDYNEEYNPEGFYAIDPFRSSDHDPIIITLNLIDCIDHLDIITATNLLGENVDTEARYTIVSGSDITGPGSLRYSAQNSVTVSSGFEVDSGTTFRIDITGCQ